MQPVLRYAERVDVILVRHATAVDETLELRDPARHLTPHGRTQAKSLGDRLRWHDCEPTRLWTSPLVRAVQTAELVAAGLGTTCQIEVVPALAPGESPRAVVTALRNLDAGNHVVLFGHEPGMSAIAALLVGNADFPALAKAEAVRITDDVLRWRFAWDAEAPTIPG
jgi:phosphohistidine phosphatase